MTLWKPIHCLIAGCGALLMHISICYANPPTAIPFKSNADSDDNLIYRAIGAFVIACAVAYGLSLLIKKYMPSLEKRLGRPHAGKQLERLETLRLSPRSVLQRVRWGNEELLLGENEHGVSLLGRHQIESGPEEQTRGVAVAKDGNE